MCDVCRATGGQGQSATATQPERCVGGIETGSDAGGADAAAGADAAGGGDGAGGVGGGGTGGFSAIPCGNANPDPCICDRAGSGPDAALMCGTCSANGGKWQPATATQPEGCVGGHDAGVDSSDGSTGNG
jgi:hypothetical protein